MNNKAILLRSVSTLATAAASTALGVHGAQAQVVPAGTDGYYYSVTGGFSLSKSEKFLTGLSDKVGASTPGASGSGSSFTPANGGSGGIYSSWSSYAESNSSGFDDFKGLFGSVSFGKQMGNLDVRGTVSMSGTQASGSSYISSGYSSYQRHSFSGGSSYHSGASFSEYDAEGHARGVYSTSLLAADFEVGYTPTLGNNLNVRLFAGLRAMKFTQRFEGYYSGYNSGSSANYEREFSPTESFSSGWYSGYNSEQFEGVRETTFTAIGPRIGVQGSTRFEGSNFGLSGSLATSVLFGKQTVSESGMSSYHSSWSSGGVTAQGSSYSDGDRGSGHGLAVNSSYSGNKTVLDLQASVGVDYYLNDSTALTIGYQAEKLVQIGGDDLGPGTNIDTLSHGAFVKLSGSF